MEVSTDGTFTVGQAFEPDSSVRMTHAAVALPTRLLPAHAKLNVLAGYAVRHSRAASLSG
jgi:hypothetical protein